MRANIMFTGFAGVTEINMAAAPQPEAAGAPEVDFTAVLMQKLGQTGMQKATANVKESGKSGDGGGIDTVQLKALKKLLKELKSIDISAMPPETVSEIYKMLTSTDVSVETVIKAIDMLEAVKVKIETEAVPYGTDNDKPVRSKEIDTDMADMADDAEVQETVTHETVVQEDVPSSGVAQADFVQEGMTESHAPQNLYVPYDGNQTPQFMQEQPVMSEQSEQSEWLVQTKQSEIPVHTEQPETQKQSGEKAAQFIEMPESNPHPQVKPNKTDIYTENQHEQKPYPNHANPANHVNHADRANKADNKNHIRFVDVPDENVRAESIQQIQSPETMPVKTGEQALQVADNGERLKTDNKHSEIRGGTVNIASTDNTNDTNSAERQNDVFTAVHLQDKLYNVQFTGNYTGKSNEETAVTVDRLIQKIEEVIETETKSQEIITVKSNSVSEAAEQSDTDVSGETDTSNPEAAEIRKSMQFSQIAAGVKKADVHELKQFLETVDVKPQPMTVDDITNRKQGETQTEPQPAVNATEISRTQENTSPQTTDEAVYERAETNNAPQIPVMNNPSSVSAYKHSETGKSANVEQTAESIQTVEVPENLTAGQAEFNTDGSAGINSAKTIEVEANAAPVITNDFTVVDGEAAYVNSKSATDVNMTEAVKVNAYEVVNQYVSRPEIKTADVKTSETVLKTAVAEVSDAENVVLTPKEVVKQAVESFGDVIFEAVKPANSAKTDMKLFASEFTAAKAVKTEMPIDRGVSEAHAEAVKAPKNMAENVTEVMPETVSLKQIEAEKVMAQARAALGSEKPEMVEKTEEKPQVTTGINAGIGFEPHLNSLDLSKSKNIVLQKYVENQVTPKILENIPQNGKSEFTFVLRPENLGRITIKLVSDAGKVTVNIIAENALTSSLLNARSEQLQANLRGNNVQLESYQVVTQQEHAQNMQNAHDSQDAWYNQSQGNNSKDGRNPEQSEQSGNEQDDESGEQSFTQQLSSVMQKLKMAI